MNRGYPLDTNVLSELMRDAPATQVLTWFGMLPTNVSRIR